MERTRLLTFAVIGLLILNLLIIGFLVLKSDRQPIPTEYQRGPLEGPARMIIDRLHFDEQQQQQYLEMARQHHQQAQRLQAESVRLFQAYYGLLVTAQPDSSEANDLVRLIAHNQQRIAELNFAHFQQIKTLCRPDQQADFTKLVADLARLFGRPQRPPRPGNNDLPEGPPENFPPHP